MGRGEGINRCAVYELQMDSSEWKLVWECLIDFCDASLKEIQFYFFIKIINR